MNRQDAQAIADEIKQADEPRTVDHWVVTGWFDGRGRCRMLGPFTDEYAARAEARSMRSSDRAVRVTVAKQRHEHPEDGGRLIETTLVDDWFA